MTKNDFKKAGGDYGSPSLIFVGTPVPGDCFWIIS